MDIDVLKHFAELAKGRETSDIDTLKAVAQKGILQKQLIEIDEKISGLQQTREILAYKISTYCVCKFYTIKTKH